VLFFQSLGEQALGTPVGRAFRGHARTLEILEDTLALEASEFKKRLVLDTIDSLETEHEDLIVRCDEILND